MDLKSAIHPAALDLMLGSATNAAQKGQGQYSTPIAVGQAVAVALPAHRPVIVDLTSGNGQLLHAVANKSTETLLAMDIDLGVKPIRKSSGDSSLWKDVQFGFIHGDLTALYQPMRDIDFRADLFALNPPWSLLWHADRLAGLKDSAVPAVAKTASLLFSPGGTVDSTLATLMIALDRLTTRGEGFLIGYTNTLERLLFADDAPGSRLVQHVWRRKRLDELLLDDMPLPIAGTPFENATVIYFSTAHDSGPSRDGARMVFMPQVGIYNGNHHTVDRWKALAEHARAMLPGAPPEFNLCLRDGHIEVRLGLFDTALAKVNGKLAQTAKRLRELNGRNPMQVVMQRNERNFIMGLLRPGADWTVDPALRQAVTDAVGKYHAVRAPLVPLPKIQRLGYLDEADDIVCIKDLCLGDQLSFKAGQRYKLASRSQRFTRTVFKPNLYGEDEELELSGQELAILITSDQEYCFMDAGLRADNVQIGDKAGAEVVDFTTQDLVDHFEIPEVPDVASAEPDRFNGYIEQLHQLEQLTA